MDERMKELIAIGAAAAVNCHPCLDFHLAECDRLGIDRDEVKAAVETGLMVGKGAAAKTRSRAEALLGLGKEAQGGCCGG